jgi:hypothetical protein
MRKMILTLFAFAMCFTAAAEDSFPNRMSQAKVGEWVLMEDVSGADIGEKTKVTVTKVADGVITVKREHLDENGNIAETKEHDIPLANYNQRMDSIKSRATSVSKEFVVIKDKEYPVTAVEFVSISSKTEDGGEREFKIWFTDELPIGGVAKIWCSDTDFPSAEVIDFGF